MKTIRALHSSCPIILLVDLGDLQAKAEAWACGVTTVLIKPVSLAHLQEAIIEVLDSESERSAPALLNPSVITG